MRLRVATAAMAVALAATPAYTVRWHVAGVPTTLLEVLLLAALLLGAVALVPRPPRPGPYAVPALLLLAGATLGLVVSPDRLGALGEWKAFFVEPIAAGLVIAGLARDAGRARLLLAGLGVAGLVAAAANLGLDLPRLAEGRFNVASPPVAIYQSANQVALFLVPLDGLALALVLFGGGLDRWAAAAFLAVTVPAVLVSYSRGGILALGAVTLFLALVHPRRRVLALPLVAALALAVALVPGIRHRIAIELDLRDPANTVAPRLGLWRGTLRMLRDRPLTGAGLRGFDQAVAPYARDPFKVAFPHQVVLNFWSETGLLGLAGFVWLTVAAAVRGASGLAGPPLARALSAGVLAFLLAVWVHGLVDVPYFKNDLALELWAVLGLQAGLAGSVGDA